MSEWQRRAEWLLKDFQAPAKVQEKLLGQILQFLNGDTRSDTITHWCLTETESGGPCCKSDSEAWNKMVSLLCPFLSRGYAVPLLYRMKHYGPAAAYIRVGCCLHQLLPRILAVDDAGIKEAGNPSSNLCQVVDALLADNRRLKSDQLLNDADFHLLVSNLLDEDKNYAAQNGARRQLVQRELSKHDFHQSSIIIDMLVQRMEPGINFFLKRTGILYDLQYLSHSNPNHEALKDDSKSRFLKVIRGDLGRELLGRYMSFLLHGLTESVTMGLDGSQAQLDLIFEMVIGCVTDLHRRLVAEFLSPPFTLLALADADESSFVTGWQQLHLKYGECACCVDQEFTTPLLQAFPAFENDLSTPVTEDQQKDIQALQEFLSEVCTWSPLSSDAVEILNGQVQWALSRRGHQFVKQGKAAIETSLLARAVKHYNWLADAASKDTMPSKMVGSQVRRKAGTRSSNQYSSRGNDTCTALVLYFYLFPCSNQHMFSDSQGQGNSNIRVVNLAQ